MALSHCNILRLRAVQMMVHWSSYLYKYPSWIDILAYCADRFTDVAGCCSSKQRHKVYNTQNEGNNGYLT
jgi:hypothetical protein